MLIRKDGIYRKIDSKDYGLYQQMGFEKVITEPTKELKETNEPMETIPEKAPLIEAGTGKVVEEPVVKAEPVEEEIVPKSKKKKKA